MEIKGIDHITINVISMQESIYFYEKILGLSKLNQIDMGDHTIQYFKLDGARMLELIKYHYDTNTVDTPIDSKGMYRHIALSVSGLKELNDQLLEKKVKLKTEFSLCEKLDFYNILIEDPNGVEIELLERNE